jgi:hypothetical protein
MLKKFANALNWFLGFIVCDNVVYENKGGAYQVTTIRSLFGFPVSQETQKIKDILLNVE